MRVLVSECLPGGAEMTSTGSLSEIEKKSTAHSMHRHNQTALFTGHGVYTYGPKGDRYSLHWFDCIGSPS